MPGFQQLVVSEDAIRYFYDKKKTAYKFKSLHKPSTFYPLSCLLYVISRVSKMRL
jgi:hypothetical protein